MRPVLAGGQRLPAPGRGAIHGGAGAAVEGAQRLPGLDKKLVEAYSLADDDREDSFAKGCALIRANLHVDTDAVCSEEQWAELYAEALWIERWRNRNLAEMIAAVFGGKGR